MLLPHMVCKPWLLVVGGQVQGSRLCVWGEGSCSTDAADDGQYKCPKHVEQLISAINHSVASSWGFFFSTLP